MSASDLLHRLEQLQTRAQLAEARSGVKLRTARYTSTRRIRVGEAAGAPLVDAFAVSVPLEPGKATPLTDIALCRTPELAKFIALLLSLGDEIVPIVDAVLRSALPQEGPD